MAERITAENINLGNLSGTLTENTSLDMNDVRKKRLNVRLPVDFVYGENMEEIKALLNKGKATSAVVMSYDLFAYLCLNFQALSTAPSSLL